MVSTFFRVQKKHTVKFCVYTAEIKLSDLLNIKLKEQIYCSSQNSHGQKCFVCKNVLATILDISDISADFFYSLSVVKIWDFQAVGLSSRYSRD